MVIENPIHARLINKIREMWMESGAEIIGEPQYWGPYNKTRANTELVLDYGYPAQLNTPEGQYSITGSCVGGFTDEFWEKMQATFNMKVLSVQKRDPYPYSGPTIKLMEKSEVFKWSE